MSDGQNEDKTWLNGPLVYVRNGQIGYAEHYNPPNYEWMGIRRDEDWVKGLINQLRTERASESDKLK